MENEIFSSILEQTYVCVLKVDFSTRQFHSIHRAQHLMKVFPEDGDQALAIEMMMSHFVAENFKKEVKEFFSFETLEERFKVHKFLSIEYSRPDGGWSIANLLPYERNQDGTLKTLILTVQANYKNLEQYKKELKFSEERQKIITALALNYLAVFLVDGNSEKYQDFSQSSIKSNLLSPFKNTESYSDAMNSYIKNCVAEEYQDYVRELADINYVLLRLYKDKRFSIRYKVQENPEKRTFFEMQILKPLVDIEDNSFIVCISCVDEAMKRELIYQKELKSDLNSTNQLYQEMIQLQSCGIITHNPYTKEIYIINQAAKRIFEIEDDRDCRKDVFRILKKCIMKDRRNTLTRINELVQSEKSFYFEFNVQHKDGKIINILAQSKVVQLQNKAKIGITTFTDFTEKAQIEDTLRRISQTDSLTGIANRGSGESKVEALLSIGKSGMFCIMDVDKFKSINDGFGHHIGDIVLQKVAAALNSTMRTNDIVFRLGGDEFCIFAVGLTSKEIAEKSINRIMEAISEIKIEEKPEVHVSLSLGAVFCNDEKVSSFDVLYQKADNAMYKAKKSEKKRFCFYQPETKIKI